jgi:Cdc6-like AAA superfamily ATPase
MAAVIEAKRQLKKRVLDTGEAYEAYKVFCGLADIRSLTGRAFGDVLAELDLYGLLRCRIVSRGRYGRSREILLDLPEELVEHIYRAILSDLEIRESHRSPHS